MCGRFTLTASFDVIQAHFEIQNHFVMKSRYNIAPSQIVAVVCKWGTLDFMTWGMIPRWMEKQGKTNPLINARGETVHEKPSFKKDFQQHRCLVLADGYYEWKDIHGRKQPFYVRYPAQRLFAFAGIWHNDSCAIITLPANQWLKKIHDRMPAIVAKDHYQRWLAPGKFESLTSFQGLDDEMNMEFFPVSTDVNRPQNDHPGCIQTLHS